jgi:hypothetical protein
MVLSCTPGLDATTLVAIGVDQPSVRLAFSAAYDSQDECARAFRAGARLEMWTDIPHRARAAGEWGAIAFDPPANPVDADSDSGRAQELVFALDAPRRPGANADVNVIRLEYDLRLPEWLATDRPARFAYTYRLRWPSGAVRWLGQFGRNGAVLVERKDPRFVLGDGWARRADGSLARVAADAEADASAEVEVGRLSRELEWSFWTFGKARWAWVSPECRVRLC